MAVNIFETYGIKEVANVSFFALADEKENGIQTGDVVLYLDSLKVSTVENTAENVSAQGGWGNPKLVTWDYGKDINVTLEDAVVSWEELRIILGGKIKKEATANEKITIHKTAEYTFGKGEVFAFPVGDGEMEKGKAHFPKAMPEQFTFIDMATGYRGQYPFKPLKDTDIDGYDWAGGSFSATESTRIRFFWDEVREGAEGENAASEIVISPNTFPGTYRVVGDALIRSAATGNDEAFQFVIEKAKMLSEVTLTMQAEGDPSTFSMTLNVLRDNNGNMMSLIKYS